MCWTYRFNSTTSSKSITLYNIESTKPATSDTLHDVIKYVITFYL